MIFIPSRSLWSHKLLCNEATCCVLFFLTLMIRHGIFSSSRLVFISLISGNSCLIFSLLIFPADWLQERHLFLLQIYMYHQCTFFLRILIYCSCDREHPLVPARNICLLRGSCY